MTTVEAGRMIEAIRKIKIHCFGTEEVEIKSNWLRLPDERRRRYLEPFNLTDQELNLFVDRFYEVIASTDLVLLGSVVDKLLMRQVYGDRAWHASAAAYEALMQRVQNELMDAGTFAVVIDDMPGKTEAGNEYRANLTRHHMKLRRTGSNLVKGMRFPSLTGKPNFVHSHLSHALQVAGLVAYNVFRQFRDYGEEWEVRGLENLPTYAWFQRILPKFRRGPNGRIQGYGVVKFPKLSENPRALDQEEPRL